MVPQAIAKPFTVAGLLVTGRCRYMGHVVNGDPSTIGSATLWDGPETDGVKLDLLTSAVFGVTRQWYGPQGILVESGIRVGAITETLTGIIYYVPQTSLDGVVIIDESGSQRVIVDMHNQVDIDAAFAAINQASA